MTDKGPKEEHADSLSEEEMKTERELYRSMLDLYTDPIVSLDTNGSITFCNEATVANTGFSREEIIGKHFSSLGFLSLEDLPKYMKIFTSLLQGKPVEPLEVIWRHKDGSQSVAEVHLGLLRSGEKILGIQALSKDITDKKEVSDKLGLYKEIIAHSNDAIAIVNSESHYIEQNSAHGALLGYSDDELIGQTPAIHLGEEGFNQVKREMKRSGTFQGMLLSNTKSKDNIIIDMSGFSINDSSGEPVFYISIMRNATERKEALDSIRVSEGRYRSLVEQSFQGILIVRGPPIGIIFSNKSFAAFLGLSVSEVLLLSETEIMRLIHPDDQRAIETRFQALLNGGPSFPFPLKIRVIRADGDTRWLELEGRRIEYEGETSLQVAVLDITDRQFQQQVIRESEERTELALKGADLGVWDWNAFANEYTFDDRWAEIFGYKLEELTPHLTTWVNMVHPDDLEVAEAKWNAHVAGETPFYSSEHRMKTKSGIWKWVSDRGKVVELNVDGTTRRATGTLLDITERKRAESALRESEEKLRNLVEQSIDGIVLADEQGLVVMWNEGLERITGIRYDEVAGEPLWEVLTMNSLPEYSTPEAKEQIKVFVQKALKEGLVPGGDSPSSRVIIHRNGSQRILQDLPFPIKTDRGFMIASFVRNISTQHKAEQALKESETRYRTLVETSPDAIVVGDLDGTITMVNERALRIIGFEKEEEMIGQSGFQYIIPEERGIALELLAKVLEIGHTNAKEFTLIRRDGRTKPVEIGASVIRDEELNPLSFVLMIRDVAERKKRETELRYAKERASLYLDLMSHDIRNQLQAILGGTEIVMEMSSSDEAKRILGGIKDGANKCERIIGKVKITEELLSVDLTPTDIVKAFKTCVSKFTSTNPDVFVESSISLEKAIVDADEFISAMCANLMENAIEHNPRDEKKVWISIDEKDGGYEISVADNGKGISDITKETLFDATRRFGGVGLHQSREIADKYGGLLKVTDRVPGFPEKGVDFRIWLPKSKGFLNPT
ncbi:MAG: PAS domain S-box protein [Candidatus Thorarchaeota archaeon]|jgi:PAS domain S-box-containing protein